MGVDDLAALNASLAQATASRIEAQARYQQSGRAGASAEALSNSAINSLRQRRAELAAEYRRLMTQFEPGYTAAPAIQAQINQLDRSITGAEGRVTSSLERKSVGSGKRVAVSVDLGGGRIIKKK